MSMQVNTETDRYIVEQVTPALNSGEEPLLAAYVTTELAGGLVSAVKAKAYFIVLTTERLYFIATRVGAFRPLLENLGIEVIERARIRGVSTVGTLAIKLDDGQKMVFLAKRSTKHVSDQARFLEALAEAYGSSDDAKKLRRAQRAKAVVGAIAVIGAAVYGYFHIHNQRARVNVECAGSPTGIRCTLEHVAGGADTHTCWKVRVNCKNGAQLESFACADVAERGTAEKLLPQKSFKLTGAKACDAPTGMKVTDLVVKAQ